MKETTVIRPVLTDPYGYGRAFTPLDVYYLAGQGDKINSLCSPDTVLHDLTGILRELIHADP
ncbi:MAG: hypothetical protein U9R01_08600 [candidate division WOR-3 bacterium]|nr:hypothetical protein [candidate division WOR-3 bacterium]